jgi:DNA-binding CsgD family transcriptional regulator
MAPSRPGMRAVPCSGSSLERTLDWLADGVALVRADGTVAYANAGFRAIVRRDDGIRLHNDMIELADAEGRGKLGSALTAAAQLTTSRRGGAVRADFVARGSAGAQPYLIHIRPLFEREASRAPSQPVAIVLVRDPLAAGTVAVGPLRELFGFTEAEAALAQALQSGVTIADYADRRAISLNTVYTHLRRLREKTGCSRMSELIHKLNELRSPLLLE